MEENKSTLLTPGEYCEALLDICQFLHCEMEYFLDCDGRFRAAAKTFWCNMREAWKRMNASVSEEDIEKYGRVLFILRGTIYKEFSRLKTKRLSCADRIIVIIKKTIDIAREYLPSDFRFKREMESAYKANLKMYDNIRNKGKKDPLYSYSNKLRAAIEEKKAGNYPLDDFDLFHIEHPKPKTLELRGEKTVMAETPENMKRQEIKF